MRVLAVDDDALVLMNTVMMLEELGHDVVETASGAQALRALDDSTFDLVVTDFMMPGMNGLELLQEVNQRRPGVPVLIVSGFVNLPGGLRREIPLLPKPFSGGQLAAAISRAVGNDNVQETFLKCDRHRA